MASHDDWTTYYFGEAWGVPALDGAEQVATPVGSPCLHCEEEFAHGDRGLLRTAMRTGANGGVSVEVLGAHRECDFRAVVGSIGHLLGTCHCAGGDMEDVPGLSRHQNAKLVWAWVQVYGLSGI